MLKHIASRYVRRMTSWHGACAQALFDARVALVAEQLRGSSAEPFGCVLQTGGSQKVVEAYCFMGRTKDDTLAWCVCVCASSVRCKGCAGCGAEQLRDSSAERCEKEMPCAQHLMATVGKSQGSPCRATL